MDRSEASRAVTETENSGVVADLETFHSENEVENDQRALRLKTDQEELSFRDYLIPEMDSKSGTSFSSEPSDQTSDLKNKLMTMISLQKKIKKELNLMKLETAQEITDISKNGGLYNGVTVTVNIEGIIERLKYLSNKEESFTIDEANEISDASHLLKVCGRPEEEEIINDVTLAGQIAVEGAILILQGEKLNQNGRILLDRCKSMFLESLDTLKS